MQVRDTKPFGRPSEVPKDAGIDGDAADNGETGPMYDSGRWHVKSGCARADDQMSGDGGGAGRFGEIEDAFGDARITGICVVGIAAQDEAPTAQLGQRAGAADVVHLEFAVRGRRTLRASCAGPGPVAAIGRGNTSSNDEMRKEFPKTVADFPDRTQRRRRNWNLMR